MQRGNCNQPGVLEPVCLHRTQASEAANAQVPSMKCSKLAVAEIDPCFARQLLVGKSTGAWSLVAYV